MSGGVIKASKGHAGKINITNSTLNFENAARGFVDGTITIKGSIVNMKGLSNGINSSTKGLNLTVDNSKLTITGSIGRALTIDGTNVDVKNNSVINFSNSLVSDILFKSEGKIEIDKSSALNFKKVKLEEVVKGTELNDLIISEKYNYESDDKGNVTITEKPSEAPEETPGESPEQTPEQKPEESPEQTPEQKPEESPEQTPEQKPSFDEIPESFIDFVTEDVFNVVRGTGESTYPLVLEVVKGTDVEIFKSVIAKYSDYELTVTKKSKKPRMDTEVESYILTFTKGEEEVNFEVLVPVTETKIIEYLDSSIEQQEQPDGDMPNTPEGNEPSDKPQQPEEDTDQPVVAPDNSDKESETEDDKIEESNKPITGVDTFGKLFTGMGVAGLGMLLTLTERFKQKNR